MESEILEQKKFFRSGLAPCKVAPFSSESIGNKSSAPKNLFKVNTNQFLFRLLHLHSWKRSHLETERSEKTKINSLKANDSIKTRRRGRTVSAFFIIHFNGIHRTNARCSLDLFIYFRRNFLKKSAEETEE